MGDFEFDLGGGYVLRSMRADDVDALYEVTLADQDRLRPWMPWASDLAVEHTQTYVISTLELAAAGQALPGVISAGDTIAGAVGFNRIDKLHASAAVGYWLAEAHVGRGLMTAAVRALLDHGFRTLELHRIEIGAAPANARSRAIPERLGFTQEGVLRESERFGDRFGDIVLYSLLAEEWG
jgi:ribosomal-protein-serine acetyltransferase